MTYIKKVDGADVPMTDAEIAQRQAEEARAQAEDNRSLAEKMSADWDNQPVEVQTAFAHVRVAVSFHLDMYTRTGNALFKAVAYKLIEDTTVPPELADIKTAFLTRLQA